MIGRQVGKFEVIAYDPAVKSCVCTCICGSGKIFTLPRDVFLKSKNHHCGCEDKIPLEKQTLERLYSIQGFSVGEIARHTGYSRNTVSKYLKFHGIQRRMPRKPDLVQLYQKEGMSVREISGLLGFSERILYQWIRRYEIRKNGQVQPTSSRGPKSQVLLGRICGELKPVAYEANGTVRCLCSCGRIAFVDKQKLYRRRLKHCGCGLSYEAERNWVRNLLQKYDISYKESYRTMGSRHPHDFALFTEDAVKFFIDVMERPKGCKCSAEVPVLHIPRLFEDHVAGLVLPVLEYLKPGCTTNEGGISHI